MSKHVITFIALVIIVYIPVQLAIKFKTTNCAIIKIYFTCSNIYLRNHAAKLSFPLVEINLNVLSRSFAPKHLFPFPFIIHGEGGRRKTAVAFNYLRPR